ncbi:MAG: DUF6169 family protein [Chitinophagaceae bacterium]|nr:DUF6169 family protein [Chitinophagaceae bacterium]
MLNPYLLQENDEYSYEFLTEQRIRYSIYFLDYSYMFSDYPAIAQNIFSFNIDVLDGNADSSVTDDRVGVTILEVFKIFFSRIENVVVYVCDSIDDRHLARKRKFDLWFWKYNDGSLLKEDGIAMIEGVEIYNSLLLHKANKKLTEIILAYKELNESAGDK